MRRGGIREEGGLCSHSVGLRAGHQRGWQQEERPCPSLQENPALMLTPSHQLCDTGLVGLRLTFILCKMEMLMTVTVEGNGEDEIRVYM